MFYLAHEIPRILSTPRKFCFSFTEFADRFEARRSAEGWRYLYKLERLFTRPDFTTTMAYTLLTSMDDPTGLRLNRVQ